MKGMLYVPSNLDAQVSGIRSWYVQAGRKTVHVTRTDGTRITVRRVGHPDRLSVLAVSDLVAGQVERVR